MADPVRTALYEVLADDDVLEALLSAAGAIHNKVAPQSATASYVLFHRSSGTSDWTFQGGHTEEAVWIVRGVCRGLSATEAEEIDARCQELLHRSRLTIPGGRITIMRESAVETSEVEDGEVWHLTGSQYRVSAT